MLGKSMVVDTKKFFGEVEIQRIEVQPKDKKDVNTIEISRLQAIKAINEEIFNNAYENFVMCSNNLSDSKNELKRLLKEGFNIIK